MIFERAFVCASIIARIKLPNSIIRIGVNYSNLYAGVIGSEHRYEYGIIGNCVNIAARLMSFAGEEKSLFPQKSFLR
jgi:class 3 adenylate cyclase